MTIYRKYARSPALRVRATRHSLISKERPKNYKTQQRKSQQELSYCKQIARQLRTQYVEGIYRPKYYIVTLKSRLTLSLAVNK